MGEPIDRHSKEVSPLDRRLAVPMFLVALTFLLITGAFLHLTDGQIFSRFGIRCLVALLVLWLLILAETVIHWRAGSRNMRQHIRFLIMPILRLCPRDHIDGESAWIAGIGWRQTSRRLEQYLSRLFSGPMIVIALLVLPVVAIEFFWLDKIVSSRGWKFAIDTCSGFIWMAFVYEFIVMVSIVDRKLRYCVRHWIDLAIVLLPLVSFIGAARLGRLVRLKQLTRTARIYRMRGLAIRAWRAVVTLNVIDKLLRRNTEYQMERLQEQIEEKQNELELMRQELLQLRERLQTELQHKNQSTEVNRQSALPTESPSEPNGVNESTTTSRKTG